MTDSPPAPAHVRASSRHHRAPAQTPVLSRRPQPSFFALLLATACSRPCVITAELDSLADAADHPDATLWEFAAVAQIAYVTRYEYTFVSYSTGARFEQPREEWVLPLVDPGATLSAGDTVHAWVMPSGPQPGGSDPEPWIQLVVRSFDGTPTRRRTALRLSKLKSPSNHTYQAIKEAERLHNLKSHPNAPIFGVK